MTSLCLLLLAAAPDLPEPLGQLDGVLSRPVQSSGNEQIVEMKLKGCDHEVPLNVSRMVAGAAFAMHQMVSWAKQGFPQADLPAPVLDAVSVGVRDGAFETMRSCSALPAELTRAPKLCPKPADDQAWLMLKGKPAALVRWSAASGKDRCLPRVSAVLFDAGGVARVRYEADFGGAASGALLGDTCKVTFTHDAPKEVFHPGLRGCKGR
ncbi:MAG: hypothetical protein IPJ65_42640 [Archangiaceae bacterium]|nr:hypothetical protein [Archangiaceae bacterium]